MVDIQTQSDSGSRTAAASALTRRQPRPRRAERRARRHARAPSATSSPAPAAATTSASRTRPPSATRSTTDPAGQGVRLPVVPARRRQPRQRSCSAPPTTASRSRTCRARRRRYTLDGAPTVDSATLDARQRERNRFGVSRYQGSAGDERRLPAVALQPLHRRALPARSGRRPRLQRRRRRHHAAQRRRRRAGRPELAARRRAHPARRPLRAARALHRRQHVAGLPGRRRRQPDQRRADHDRRQLAHRRPPVGRVRAGRVAGDEGADGQLRPALRPGRTPSSTKASSARAWAWSTTSRNDLRLHAGYARYFTPPPTEKIDTTSVAKFQGTTNALPSDANTAVKSERSNYFDAGAGVPADAAAHARHRRLLPQGAAPAGRGPVRQRADLLGVQLRAGRDRAASS